MLSHYSFQQKLCFKIWKFDGGKKNPALIWKIQRKSRKSKQKSYLSPPASANDMEEMRLLSQ